MSENSYNVALILDPPDFGMKEAYKDFFTSRNWGVKSLNLRDAKFDETLTIIDFRVAVNNIDRAMEAPVNRVAYDYHFDPSHATDILNFPFHLFDNASVIVHDEEARWFVKEVVRPVNARALLFTYPSVKNSTVDVEDSTASGNCLFAPIVFKDHPWLDNLDVTFIGANPPDKVSAGSILTIPDYHPTVWEATRWAAAGGTALVAPGLFSFRKLYGASALLFSSGGKDDFLRKIKTLCRPAAERPVGDKLKVAVAVPLYKKDAPGGAEIHAGGLAKAFIDAGHDAEVFATQTDSMLSWNNNLPKEDSVNGVPVKRFAVDNADNFEHHKIGHKIVLRDELSYNEYTRWMETNIRSTEMEKAIADSGDRYDALFFIPYLYGTTFWGSQVAPERSYLLPCYHDEPHAYAPVFGQNALWSAGIFFNTNAERRLAESTLGIINKNAVTVGEGIDHEAIGDADRFREKFNVTGDFILYVGRIQREKNVPELLEFHAELKEKTGKSVPLLLAGKGDMNVSDDPESNIRYLGFISEQDKIDAYAACSAFVLPSTKESFSIVMMEAWAQGKPVIAHGECNVSREHLFRCQGGFLYHDSLGYADAISKIIGDNGAAKKMGEKGQAYVRENFRWSVVVDRIIRAIRDRKEESLSSRLGNLLHDTLSETDTRNIKGFGAWVDEQPYRSAGLNAGRETPISALLDIAETEADIDIEYREFSTRPVIGTFFSKVRGAMTKHLRANYIKPLERRQSRFNKITARMLRRFFEGE